MTNKENAERIIRYLQENVEGLKELSAGCQFKYNGFNWKIGRINKWGVLAYIDHEEAAGDSACLTQKELQYGMIYEIIGHEPELRHLLLAITGKPVWITGLTIENGQKLINIDGEGLGMEGCDYDLTKSLLANLEDNEELTTYLINLFNLN